MKKYRLRHVPQHDHDIRRVGITGSAGCIGTVLREMLPNYDGRLEYVHFTMTDNDIDGSIGVDLSQPDQVKEKFKGLDCVVHLAAVSNASASWEDVVKHNVHATYNVLQECVHSNVKKIIFASSNHVMNGHVIGDYSIPESINSNAAEKKFTETDMTLADSLYGVSKITGEELCKHFAARYGLEVICFRIGWVRFDDDPSTLRDMPQSDYIRVVYLSQIDCSGAFYKAIITKPEKKFTSLNLLSDNTKGVYNLDAIQQVLGLKLKGNSENFY
nr:PREDICTED: GDP-mannose 3,5-epimerase 1-like [Saccoglossus kowalevskii]